MKLFDNIAISHKFLSVATEIERKVFVYAWDKTRSFGLRFRQCELMPEVGEPSEDMFYILDQLAARKLTGDLARAKVLAFAEKHGSLIQLICNKHLQIGVTATTVNKYWPKLIPVFQVQLAKEEALQKVKFPCYGQLKYDGVRIIIMKTLDDQLYFYTRNGLEIELPKIAKVLSAIPAGTVLDTEVTLKAGTVEDRAKVSGMINSARQKGKIDESLLSFNVFDLLTYEEFQSQSCRVGYKERLKGLEAGFNLLFTEEVKTVLTLAETKVLTSAIETNAWFEEVLAKGQEGLILKPMNHLYTFKRSKDWIKLKATKTADLKCIGIEEGDNKYSGMIGALVCEGMVDHIRVKVKIGSGLTDHDRRMSPTAYIGKTIEIKYNTIISNNNGTTSLFLPRFVAVRYDK